MITVNRRDFITALRRASKVSPKTTHILPLQTVQLRVDTESITLKSTNLDLALVEILAAQGQARETTVCIPIHQLLGTVLALPQFLQEVPLEPHPEYVVVGTTKLPAGCDSSDFPVVPRPPEDAQANVELPADFPNHLRFVRAAVSQDAIRGPLQGVVFDFKNGNIAASDGKRLHVAHLWAPAEVENVIIPPSAFDLELPTHLSIPKPAQDKVGTVFLYISNGYIVSNTLEGTFPAYRALIPKEHRVAALVDRAELLSAIDQSFPAVSDRNPACTLHFNEHVEIRAENKESGASYVNELDAVVDGPEILVHVNPHNLRGMLASMTGQSITLTFRKPGEAIYIVSDQADQWALIMPLVFDSPPKAQTGAAR